MWLIARLHYVYRVLLLLIDRLVHLETTAANRDRVCCDVAATLTTKQTNGQHSRTVQPNTTSLRLVAPSMRQSTTVTCGLANEYLRRRNRTKHDATNHPGPDLDHCAGCTEVSFEDVPAQQTNLRTRRNRSAYSRSGALRSLQTKQSVVETNSKVTFARESTGAILCMTIRTKS